MLFFFTGHDAATYALRQRCDYPRVRGAVGFAWDGRYKSDGYLRHDHAFYFSNSGFNMTFAEFELGGVDQVVIGGDIRPSGPELLNSDFLQAGYWDGAAYTRRVVLVPNTTVLGAEKFEFFRGRSDINFDFMSWPEPHVHLGDTGTSIVGSNFMQLSQWNNWEFVLRSTGSSEIWRDGVMEWTGAIACLGNFNRAGFVQNALTTSGMAWDNLYIGSERLGALRAAAALPTADALIGWVPKVGSVRYSQLNEQSIVNHNLNCPDGDTSYIRSVTPSEKVLFAFERLMPFGAIVAVQVTAFVRSESATGTFKFVLKSPEGDEYLSAAKSVDPTYVVDSKSYQGFRYLLERDPATGLVWTDERLLEYQFGLQNEAAIPVRCSQIFVERLSAIGGGAFAIYRAR